MSIWTFCLLRKTVIAGGLIVAYDLLARFTTVLPMTGQSLEAWDQGADMTSTLVWSLGLLLVCAAVSYVFFRKAKLP